MSPPRHRDATSRKACAQVFAALGDETRLAVLGKLSRGEPQSIARLTAGTSLSRQAVSKHLCVLEDAGVVTSVRAGREHRFALAPTRLRGIQKYLADVSRQWDDALTRLKDFVEE